MGKSKRVLEKRASEHRSRRSWILSAGGLILVLVVSFLVEAWVAKIEQERLGREFQRASKERADAIQVGFHRLDDLLIQVRDRLAAQESLTSETFRHMASPWLSRHSALLALGWIPKIGIGQERGLMRKARLEGRRSYAVEPGSQSGQDDRPRFPVFYLEGRGELQDLLGVDLASNPVIGAELVESRDCGQARLLTQGDSPFSVPSRLSMILPFYGRGPEPLWTTNRRQEHSGFLLAIWSTDALLAQALSPFSPGWARVRLGQEGRMLGSHGQTAWETGVRARKGEMDLSYHKRIHVHGLELGLGVVPGAAFLQQRRSTASGLALVATAFFLLVFVFSLRILFNRKGKVEDFIRRRVSKLEKNQEELTTQIEISRSLERSERVFVLAMREFISRTSQEIRGPLTALLGYSEYLADPDMDDQDRREHLEVLKRNGRHLSAIFGDLVDLSRIEADTMVFETGTCDPLRILKEVGFLMSVRAAAKGLELKLATRKGMPEEVHSDAVRLRQILMNLSRLGIDLTKRGVVKLRMSSEGDQCLRLEIECGEVAIPLDQMQGILDDDPEKETDALDQLGGAGLVLILTRRLVFALEGSFEILDLGEGRWRIRVDLPSTNRQAVRSLLDGSSFEGLERGGDLGDKPLAGHRLLIVDGSAEDGDLLRQLLQEAGALVEEAPGGQQLAGQILSRGPIQQPELVILNVRMPEARALDSARRLREQGFDRPLLALSAHIDAETERACLRAGCDSFLCKPIDKESLLLAIIELLPRAMLTGHPG